MVLNESMIKHEEKHEKYVITVMKIAIEGCAHGELEKIYDTIELIEKNENIHVDLLICCGDFQSTRNLEDLRCMAVPPKYYNICTFYKYYSGEKVAPYLTIFIGGNHEASNYLQELAFGGWVAPNIYYLGYAGVVNVGGIRIGGISGIYKSNDYFKGRYEYSPYSESTKRSIYHIRNLDIFRLKQITQPIDIFLSHDWPRGVHKYGDEKELLRNKPFFQSDIEENRLGSEPATELLHHLKPKYWFSAHLHTKFPAIIQHNDVAGVDTKVTKFLALDKCLPKRKFLQVIDIANDNELSFKYDLEWLTILYLTNHLTTVKCNAQYMPGPGSEGRWVFTPTKHEMNSVLEKFQNDLTIPNNFIKTARAYDPTEKEQTNPTQPPGQTNPQTTLFCEKLGIDDPTYLILKQKSHTNPSFNACRSRDSFNFIPASVEKRLNISLPEKKIQEYEMPKPIKLNLTLPAPKNVQSDVITESAHTDIIDSFNDTELNTSELNSTTIFSEDGINTSTPQKKFKRRNESIYKTLD